MPATFRGKEGRLSPSVAGVRQRCAVVVLAQCIPLFADEPADGVAERNNGVFAALTASDRVPAKRSFRTNDRDALAPLGILGV